MAILWFSCDVPVELDLKQTEPKVVIEGHVTNVPGYQYVKLSMSTGFYELKNPAITNADVVVSDDHGNTIVFVHNPRNHVDSAGVYLPAQPFVGTVGRQYTLRVEAGGKLYEAIADLLPVIPFDSVTYRVNTFQETNPRDEGRIYELLMFADEPQDERNYYLFKFYRNDSLTYFNRTDIYYTDDAFVAGRVDGFPSPVYYGIGDKAKIEVYSLSRDGYIFFNDLSSVMNNDAGGMFGPITSSPRTNLSNDALGFFQTSAVETAIITIE